MQEAPPNIFNTFKGYKVTNENIIFDDTLNINDSLIYKHLKLVICNNNDKILDYMSNVISRILNNHII